MTLFENELETIPPAHYYGDTIRNLFLMAAATFMLLAVFDRGLLVVYLFPGICTLLALVVLAGLTSPTKHFSIVADTILSAVLFVIFEYSAIIGSESLAHLDIIFMLRQLLAVFFFLTLYFSVKTWRGAASQPPFPLS